MYKRQACNQFVGDFRRDTSRAMNDARRQRVDDEFLIWFYSPASDTCLAPANSMASLCAGLSE